MPGFVNHSLWNNKLCTCLGKEILLPFTTWVGIAWASHYCHELSPCSTLQWTKPNPIYLPS